ncbi:MAG: hypothetical protein WKF43_04210 [Acidimicrobiales bacterium]
MTRFKAAPLVRTGIATFVAIVLLSGAALVSSAAPPVRLRPTAGSRGVARQVERPHVAGPHHQPPAGRHTCYDRLVVDLRSTPAPGYFVRYVSQVVEDGSGEPVPLRGGAFLHVTVRAPAHDGQYGPTYDPPNPAEAVNVTGFGTFRQIAFAGTFEGVTTVGLGVRARLPFRVFTLAGPGAGTRLVIDVAHRWS